VPGLRIYRSGIMASGARPTDEDSDTASRLGLLGVMTGQEPDAILEKLVATSVTRRRSCDSMEIVANRSVLRASLERTTGTVTDFLEQLVGEKIDAHTHDHEVVQAHNANGLGVEEGEPLLHRAATLRGRTSGCSYVYAESVIVVGRLPTGFCHQLETSTDPIGRILDEMGIAVTRQGVGEPDVVPRPNRDVKVGGYLLARTYRLDSEQTPVMIITEWFLPTLIPFLSLG
jgi:chorismate-pyruvate lyase